MITKFKKGDNVLVVRMETKLRPATKEEKAQNADCEAWITEPAKQVKLKAVVDSLHNLYIGVQLSPRKVRHCLYVDLQITKRDISFLSHLPAWKGIKAGREVTIPGKEIRIKGQAVLEGLHIPLIIDGKPLLVPYENIVFKESK